MILVTGAAGKTGKAVIAALAARGTVVRAHVHREEQTGAALAQGAREVCVGSFEDAAALAQVMLGASAVYHICPNMSPREVDYARAVGAAAKVAGVRRLVYHSVLHPQIEAMPHHWEKMRAEELLFAADLDVTVLQPTAYMQNILAGWRDIVEAGIYRVPYPVESRISLVDLDDVAAAAALVLTQPGHGGAIYELVGTAPLSQTEVASLLSEALGKPVRAVAEPVEAWEARAGGLGDYQRETLAKMFRYYAAHGLVGNANALTWLLGRTPTSFPEFVRRLISPSSARSGARSPGTTS
jgi:NAD(P)H dehydrogenase (quinone)